MPDPVSPGELHSTEEREETASDRNARSRSSSVALTVVRRLGLAFPLVLLVSFVIFVLVDLTPGDRAIAVAGADATPEQIAVVRNRLGLDQPMFVRYFDWITDAMRGDLGTSWRSSEDVTSILARRLPVTLSLTTVTLAIVVVLAVMLGVSAALRPGGFVDRVITGVCAAAIAAPPFWLAMILILTLSLNRGWFPALGYEPLSSGVGTWLRHLMLPAAALASTPAAELALQLKSSLVDVMGRDYVLSARAKGLSASKVVLKHALKNALIPVVTVLGYRAAQLLGGTAVIEAVFALRGLGELAVSSTLGGDMPVLLGLVLLTTFVVVCVNLLVDLSYLYFDPKARTRIR